MLRGAIVCLGLFGACGTDREPLIDLGPATYVRKVKDVLVGLPPTDEEAGAVTQDSKALAGLVDTWLATPEYRAKQLAFFELAFQQTEFGAPELDALTPTGNGRNVPLLIQNMQQSFARTAQELVSEGRPFTETFTTHRVMMTSALIELYAYLETVTFDNAGQGSDSFAAANPQLMITLEEAQGPIDPAVTANPASSQYMHWYTPGITTAYSDASCAGVDPITIPASARTLHELFYGLIPAHTGKSGGCAPNPANGAAAQLTGKDFTDWRMVTIRQPAPGETTTRFFDLASLRSTKEVVLHAAHPGFFTTPAFFANWPTNGSNQMRVTLNQALIVATGTAVDGADPTMPTSTPGLDTQHSAPSSPCFSCHQLLDPTRAILSSTFSYGYSPQRDPALIAQPGAFAFQGVVAPMATIDDFASLLATHPLVAQGWTQKLCYYVNSAPCDPQDPEFVRIATDFAASGYAWNTLVREIATSPITTNTSPTVTNQISETISARRRDHLCAALDHRLGFVDICMRDLTLKTTKQYSSLAIIANGMPADGYGRGATAPVVPDQPTLFFESEMEKICEAVAPQVIDAPVDPKQPSARHWSSDDAQSAIRDFVTLMMGFTMSDPRTPRATSILAAHYAAAQSNGAKPTDALRSTFVAACLSPSFVSIGL